MTQALVGLLQGLDRLDPRRGVGGEGAPNGEHLANSPVHLSLPPNLFRARHHPVTPNTRYIDYDALASGNVALATEKFCGADYG